MAGVMAAIGTPAVQGHQGSAQASVVLCYKTYTMHRRNSFCAEGRKAELIKLRVPIGAENISSNKGKLPSTVSKSISKQAPEKDKD